MSASLDLWPIGNCQVSALLDDRGSLIWGCLPRVDGDPTFCALLAGDEVPAEAARGFWDIELDDCVKIEQHYLRNTPILVTRHEDRAGAAIEVIDFAPRYRHRNRIYRPVAFVRIVRPLAGNPRIRVRLRPAHDWGAERAKTTRGTNHIRYLLTGMAIRLTSNAPLGWIEDERLFRVEHPLHFFLGPDESFSDDVRIALETMLDRTAEEWREWVRGLATPVEWQEAVIRAAITLKLCQHEETGAIVAAMTTSLPEHAVKPGELGRNWDYRYCWIRDAYYTVQALNRLGALDVLESYLAYLRNVVDNARRGHIQPLYGVGGEARLEERVAPALAGYRGMGPVRVGNEAYVQVQNDAFGQIILSSTQSFFDQRLLRPGTAADFAMLEEVGERAWEKHDQPDAGLWELRTKNNTHTYSVAMCWAACDRLANAATELGLPDKAGFWQDRADRIRVTIERCAWRPDSQRMSATFEGDDLDASLIQLLDLRFVPPDDPRFQATLRAVEAGLRRGSTMLRYDTEDDFGLPETAFNVCTFWLIEALHATGRLADARALFEEMLARRTRAGLLSEDIDPVSGELWGNYPQTYSLVGIINCAVLLSKPWSAVR
jgi:GH15 family glucan-1,4-alpha-glucosidase